MVDGSVPSAPWLEDRVLAAVRDAASSKNRSRNELVGIRFTAAALAAMVVALLIVVTLLGSRLNQLDTVPGSSAGPSRDAAVVAYRAMVDGDMGVVHRAYAKDCTSRQTCAWILSKARDATQALQHDTSATTPPASIAPAVRNVEAAATHFTVQLDAAILALESPTADYRSALAGPTISELDLAVGVLDCWPITPVADNAGGYGCTPIRSDSTHW